MSDPPPPPSDQAEPSPPGEPATAPIESATAPIESTAAPIESATAPIESATAAVEGPPEAPAPPAAPPKPPGRLRRAFRKIGRGLNVAGDWIARQFEGIPPRRSWALLATAVLPPLAILIIDSIRRREMFVNRAGPPIGGYIGGALLSLSLWGFCLESARHPKRRVRYPALFVLALTGFFGIGGQLLFQSTAHEYYNRDAVLFAIDMGPIILNYLKENLAVNLAVLLGSAAFAVAYAIVRHRLHGPRQRLAWYGAGLALLATLLNAFIPWKAPAWKHGLPPEVLFWHAAGGASLYAAGILDKPNALPPGKHLQLPRSKTAVGPDAPDIVLIFGESVRRDEVCSVPSPSCKKSPELDAAAPDRFGWKISFSVASCTEVSSAILWSGLHIFTKPAEIQTAPLIWDYAKARGYRTAYLTSQNLSFQDQGTFLRTSQIDEKREARDRNPHSDLDIGSPDEGTAQEVLDFLAKGGGPALAVLHFSNTHLPYRQVPGYTPNDASAVDSDSKKEAADARRAKYRNAIFHQDHIFGLFLTELRKTERGKRTIVIYTSDHGEAWGEHGSWTHTFDLYGDQINVPLWMDVPPGVLSDAQRNWLKNGQENRPVYTADVNATVLDMMGVLDDPELAPQVKALAGTSLLRPLGQRDVVLSNCPPFRGCFPDAWGVVRWPMKFQYIGRATESSCIDWKKDPDERSPLPTEKCQNLRAIVAKQYGIRADKTWSKFETANPSAAKSFEESLGLSGSAPQSTSP